MTFGRSEVDQWCDYLKPSALCNCKVRRDWPYATRLPLFQTVIGWSLLFRCADRFALPHPFMPQSRLCCFDQTDALELQLFYFIFFPEQCLQPLLG